MAEPSLRDVQRWIKARVRHEADPQQGAAEPVLNPQRGTPGTARLAVYAEGYQVRIQQALAEVYPAVRHLVGGRAFAALSQAYAAQYPSHEANLSFAGRHLPECLTTYPLSTELPFLPELAKLEWLVCRAFHAFEQTPLDPARLAARSPAQWDRLRFRFQPSVGLVASAWPILDLWEARSRRRAEIDIEVVGRPQRVLVFRRELQVRCELVEDAEYAVLEGLLAGQALGAVCRTLAEPRRGQAPPVQQWFARWMQGGLIVHCAGGAERVLAPPRGAC